jgi:hypothetical protein
MYDIPKDKKYPAYAKSCLECNYAECKDDTLNCLKLGIKDVSPDCLTCNAD